MEKSKIIAFLKIVSIVILLACLMDMPYGYYQLVRFIETGIFIFLGFTSIQSGRKIEGYFFLVLAILFQPFIKISLGRNIWNLIDVLVASSLLIQILKNQEWKVLKSN